MEEKLLVLYEKHYKTFPSSWSEDQKATELAQYALENTDLPDLYTMLPKEWDRLVEDTFDFYRGEFLYHIEKEK